MALHVTVIPLRSVAVGKLYRYFLFKSQINNHLFRIRKTQRLDQSMEYMIKGIKTG